MPVVFYDSLGEFSASLPVRTKRPHGNDRNSHWNAGQTYAESKANLWLGCSDTLSISERVLAQVEADGLELTQTQWEQGRIGFIPCVPSYLAGSPDSMRRLVEDQADTTPIKLFVDVCLSGGFTSEQITQRGSAILALARKLASVRCVEVWLFASLEGRSIDQTGNCAIPVIRLDTNPLDLATASYAIGNAAFMRQLCFAWGYERGFDGHWAWRGSPAKNREKLIKFLGVGDQDMIIDGGYLSDELMRNPVAWVNAQVKRYASVLEQV